MGQDMKREPYKPNDEVWYTDSYGTMRSGVVEKSEKEHEGMLKIRGTRGNYGSHYVKEDACYDSESEAWGAYKAKQQERTNEYLSKLKTPEDLVRFMYDNQVSPAEEYTDEAARDAACIAAKNIMGIDLETEATQDMENGDSLGKALESLQAEISQENSL